MIGSPLLGHAAVLASLASLAAAVPGGQATAVAEAPPTTAGATPERAAGWRPGVRAAKRYARSRSGDVRFAIERFDRRTFSFHAGRAAPMRSVFKVMLMTAYLSKRSVRERSLERSERRLLGPMIRRSDDAAATEINRRLSGDELERLARRARMKRFRYEPVIWGNSRSTAADQVRFMRRLKRLLPERHRAYGRGLMKRIVGSQRWGVAEVSPPGWKLMFKSGWGSGTGEADHQVAILERGFCRIALSVFTVANPSHAYARRTQRGVARRLLRGLDRSICPTRRDRGAP